jgi:hypothetical protein
MLVAQPNLLPGVPMFPRNTAAHLAVDREARARVTNSKALHIQSKTSDTLHQVLFDPEVAQTGTCTVSKGPEKHVLWAG